MPDLEHMVRRQKILADFGEFALRNESLTEVLTEACRLVGEALGTKRAKVLEIEESSQSLLVRAGVGWEPDVVGKLSSVAADDLPSSRLACARSLDECAHCAGQIFVDPA